MLDLSIFGVHISKRKSIISLPHGTVFVLSGFSAFSTPVSWALCHRAIYKALRYVCTVPAHANSVEWFNFVLYCSGTLCQIGGGEWWTNKKLCHKLYGNELATVADLGHLLGLVLWATAIIYIVYCEQWDLMLLYLVSFGVGVRESI